MTTSFNGIQSGIPHLTKQATPSLMENGECLFGSIKKILFGEACTGSGKLNSYAPEEFLE